MDMYQKIKCYEDYIRAFLVGDTCCFIKVSVFKLPFLQVLKQVVKLDF